jgi:hypothetical protein
LVGEKERGGRKGGGGAPNITGVCFERFFETERKCMFVFFFPFHLVRGYFIWKRRVGFE